jgi:hypothetical protein
MLLANEARKRIGPTKISTNRIDRPRRFQTGRLRLFFQIASLPNLVAFADRCEDAIEIPETGGLFQGNTATAMHDYSAGCDTAGAPDAPDQMLKLALSDRRRVVFDMAGSGYETLLDVRRGPACPGEELSRACTAGFVEGRSFLDLILEPGEYFVQIDGFAGARGPWTLDVHVVEPP